MGIAEILLIALAAVLAVGGIISAIMVRRARQRADQAEERLEHLTVRDERTGLLNPKGAALVGAQIIEIAKRDSDAVCACLVRLAPRPGVAYPSDDDVLTLAEAAVEVFRAGDVVSRLDTDTVLMVGKGTRLDPEVAHSRLTQQMVKMIPPGDRLPDITVGTGMLAPWEEGDLTTLMDRALLDLNARLSIR